MKICFRSLQGTHARNRDKSFVGSRSQGIDFLLDQSLLLGRRDHLGLITAGALNSLSRLLSKYGGLRGKQRAASSKLIRLDADRFIDLCAPWALSRTEFRRPGDCRRARQLCFEPGLLCLQIDHLGGKCPLLRPDFRPGQLDQQITLVDLAALRNVDRRDHSAVAMLDRLALTGNDKLARCIGSRIQWRECGPSQEQDEEQSGNDNSKADIAAGIVDTTLCLIDRVIADNHQAAMNVLKITAHKAALFLIGRGADSIGVAGPPPRRAMISSREPKASSRPSRSTMILSTAARTPRRCATTSTAACRAFSATRVSTSWPSPLASRWALGS